MGQRDARGERPAPARGTPAARGGGGGPAELMNALEVLRVATTLFVVLYHVGLTYVATPLRLTLWVAYDKPGLTLFDSFIYWVNGFAMPVFFLAAGVSAPAACESRGVRVFIKHRVSRLLRPLLFGCLTVLPAFYLLWGYGLMVTGRCTLDHILAWRYPAEVRPYLYGLGHLWFLEYLFLVCLVWSGGWWVCRALLARGAAGGGGGSGWVARVIASPWRPLLLAVPTALIFLIDSDTMLRVDNTIVPNPFRLLHYTYFFTVGAWIGKVREPKGLLVRHARSHLAASAVVFAVMLPLLLQHAAAPLHGWTRVAYCGLAALFPWLTVFGSLGVLLRVVQSRGAAMRFLTEASFWVYIVHVPIVAFAQLVLLGVAWPAPVKFLIVSAVAIALSLVSYEFIVRRSLVGEIVNGARKRSTKRGLFGPEFGWVATAAVAILVLAGTAWHYRVFFWGDNLHEEARGQFYRSGRLKAQRLDELIRAKGLRSVITFTAGGDNHRWFTDQRRVCQARGVEVYGVLLRTDVPASREALLHLADVLKHAPRPILVQSNRGLDQSGFTVALGELLSGGSVQTALRQFDSKYAQFGGAECSPLGQTLLQYDRTLRTHGRAHSGRQFLAWVRDEYQAGPAPAAPPVARDARPAVRVR
jgi:peptidoglycan/LPS O-acetylase OafA/YrhL